NLPDGVYIGTLVYTLCFIKYFNKEFLCYKIRYCFSFPGMNGMKYIIWLSSFDYFIMQGYYICYGFSGSTFVQTVYLFEARIGYFFNIFTYLYLRYNLSVLLYRCKLIYSTKYRLAAGSDQLLTYTKGIDFCALL